MADIERNTGVAGLQDNVFVFRAEAQGTVYADADGNGRQDRRESGLRGVLVELINDEGEVIAAQPTDSRGGYRFNTFHETGDYQVRVVPPERYVSTTASAVELLISRGDQSIRDLNFGLR